MTVPALAFAGAQPENLGLPHRVDVDPRTGAATVRVSLELAASVS